MSLSCIARLESGLVGAMLQSWCCSLGVAVLVLQSWCCSLGVGKSLVADVIEGGRRMRSHDS
jgi:hypothetical protein